MPRIEVVQGQASDAEQAIIAATVWKMLQQAEVKPEISQSSRWRQQAWQDNLRSQTRQTWQK